MCMTIRIITSPEKTQSPSVQVFDNSSQFYEGSPSFVRGSKSIKFSSGILTCQRCSLKHKDRRGSFVGYCFVRKRMVDMNENCNLNTAHNYTNVNMPH